MHYDELAKRAQWDHFTERKNVQKSRAKLKASSKTCKRRESARFNVTKRVDPRLKAVAIKIAITTNRAILKEERTVSEMSRIAAKRLKSVSFRGEGHRKKASLQ